MTATGGRKDDEQEEAEQKEGGGGGGGGGGQQQQSVVASSPQVVDHRPLYGPVTAPPPTTAAAAAAASPLVREQPPTPTSYGDGAGGRRVSNASTKRSNSKDERVPSVLSASSLSLLQQVERQTDSDVLVKYNDSFGGYNNYDSRHGNNDSQRHNSGSGSGSGSRGSSRHSYHPANTFRRVQRVSRTAALTTKQQLWDSNAISIDAAMSAVDQWEGAYNALRGLLVASAHSARGLYGKAKEGSAKIEHNLLLPVRDWILLPAFTGLERAVGETIGFFQSDAAQHLYGQSLELARKAPYGIGESILEPALKLTVTVAKRSWEIAQYPIPSKQQVHDTVNFALNGAKWALTQTGREIYLYVKRADANITRSLSHTQWKVLGSGPYATLDKLNKRDVIDHLCERYFALSDTVARYELAAHIRRHNPPLYHDLVLTGLLKDRGGDITVDDEWLSTCPSYRNLESEPFLLQTTSADESLCGEGGSTISALWYRLPNVNGKRPGKDAPWICFRRSEIRALEMKYRQLIKEGQGRNEELLDATAATAAEADAAIDETVTNDKGENKNEEQRSPLEGLETPTKRGSSKRSPQQSDGNNNHENIHSNNNGRTTAGSSRHPTVAQWYNPDVERDVWVDQKRAAVSFFRCCPKCREPQGECIPPLVHQQHQMGDLCDSCQQQQEAKMPSVATLLAPPPISMIMRPTLWRFYGPGDAVRRATWFLDTSRNGLQPFDEDATAILEDAYLFLRWMSIRQGNEGDDSSGSSGGMDEALLTVECPCPDGTDRLVQFSSLTQATAIQKGLGSAMSLFKRRVYRGAWLSSNQSTSSEQRDCEASIEESIIQAVEDGGSLGDTLVPDMSIRSALTPKPASPQKENRQELFTDKDALAAPPDRVEVEDDEKSTGRVDHLVLIVHGIGEMLRSIDVFGLSMPNLSSIIDCCAWLRKNHTEVQDAHFRQMYPDVEISQFFTGRVEYLPVEWHEAFAILSQRRQPASPEVISRNGRSYTGATSKPRNTSQAVLMKDITLRTIPNMREFANDTLMDVLYFMSPEHHDLIIDVVTTEMNIVVNKFRNLTGFNGRISVIGHSLGSIVTWDILSNQKIDGHNFPQVPSLGSLDDISPDCCFSPATGAPKKSPYVFGGCPSPPLQPEVTHASSSSGSRSAIYPQLGFQVDNFFLLGSPVAVFLMIRNQREPLSDAFYLPGCNRVFNVFHPYDPVAYRIEPCIDPRNAGYEPTIMKHWNGGFRVQYQTKRLWRHLVNTTWKTQQTVVEAFEASMAGMGLIDSTADVNDDEEASLSDVSRSSADSRSTRVNTGALNRGRRIDYMLQEREIENANEYVAALAAHSSYWTEKDFSLFVARQIYLSALEKQAAELEHSESWEPCIPDASN